MNIIYQPKGKALEYAGLALNLYNGCTHGCRYCFNDLTPWNGHYFEEARPKANVIERVQKDAEKLAEIYSLASNGCPEILISFVGDPYQPAEKHLKQTRAAIEILIAHNLPFAILTKAGMLATRDFDLLENYPQCRFGVTITLVGQEAVNQWEPNAPFWIERMKVLRLAKRRGIKTWLSLEPVIDPKQALMIIDIMHDLVDHWKIGKINHWPEIERQHNWIKFREDARALLDGLGADYYFKKSLADL